MNQRLTCIVCSTPLTGRQRFYCSGRCRKRGQRHPDLYPKPQPRKPNTAAQPPAEIPRAGRITTAVRRNNKQDVLDELLLRLAMEIDQATDPKTIAPLSARLIDVLDRVEDADNDSEKGGSFLDELTARRAQRPEAG